MGTWHADVEANVEPGKPPEKAGGTEHVREIGDSWVVSEYQGKFMGKPLAGVFSLGYDSDKKKFLASWIGSMDRHLWTYEGSLDKAGKVLTLNGEGPCADTGKMVKVRDTFEFKDRNCRVMTSRVKRDGNKWVTGMTINARRN